MLTSSAKSKGRRACQELRELLLKNAPELHPDDITVTPSGVTGPDLWLSPRAQEIYPWCKRPEVKNQEKLNIHASFEQAKSHVKDETPVLFYKRNRSELMVTMRAEDLLKLVRSQK